MSDKKQFAVVMLVSALFVAWILYSSLGVLMINNELKSNPELQSYPYQFRVLKTEGRVAVMSTIRTHELPTLVALRVLHPELADKTADSPEVLRAERNLARMQALAQKIVLAHPEFEFIRWELDENWLRIHNVNEDLYADARLTR